MRVVAVLEGPFSGCGTARRGRLVSLPGRRLPEERTRAIQDGCGQAGVRLQETPVEVAYDEERHRTFWLFDDEFYWDDEGFEEIEVKALILERRGQKDRRVQRAVVLMQQTEAMDAPARAAIADEVKVFVWNRDGGRCVKCGSNQRLEFDHVIPVALGGANTARNLQLLCETCNRSKGASIV